MARLIRVTLESDDGSVRELLEPEAARWMEWISGHVDWDMLPETDVANGATRFLCVGTTGE